MMFTFKSGRRIYNWGDAWSLGSDMDLAYGYDSHVSYEDGEENKNDITNGLFPEDAEEIADLMIARWMQFRDRFGRTS